MDISGHFLHSKEGMTQGYPLAMTAYDIGILTLILYIRAVHSQVMQLWYTDDAGAGGKFEALQEHMRDMMVRGPPWGYFTDPTKRILFI